MQRPNFYFLEASKVGTYHITLIDGYLSALASSRAIRERYKLSFASAPSIAANLTSIDSADIAYKKIPVISQDKRWVIRKTLLEFFVAVCFLLRLRKNDILFISCIMPTALLLLELLNRVLRRRNVFVVVHGEMEALFSSKPLHWRSIGYWALKWLAVRSPRSLINVVGIDDFIKNGLTRARPDKLPQSRVFSIPHPLAATDGFRARPMPEQSICFIGYRTPAKGFDAFSRLSSEFPQITFFVIGSGKIERLGADTVPLTGSTDFLAAVAGCSMALFPYNAGYDCSLSAAALDALSTGVHIVATPRASFVGLQEGLGSDVVTIYHDENELRQLLRSSGWLEAQRAGQPQRREALATSKYSKPRVALAFEKLANSVYSQGA